MYQSDLILSSVMASPNPPTGTPDRVKGDGNNKDDARPDEVKGDGNKKDDTSTEEQQTGIHGADDDNPRISLNEAYKVMKQTMKAHKQKKKEKRDLKKAEKEKELVDAGMITPGRVPPELVPQTCPRERPRTPVKPGPLGPRSSTPSSASRPLP